MTEKTETELEQELPPFIPSQNAVLVELASPNEDGNNVEVFYGVETCMTLTTGNQLAILEYPGGPAECIYSPDQWLTVRIAAGKSRFLTGKQALEQFHKTASGVMAERADYYSELQEKHPLPDNFGGVNGKKH